MRLLLAAFALLFLPFQDYTAAISLTGNTVTVAWTAPESHSTSDWIGLYKVGSPNEPAPSSLLWKYLTPGVQGTMEFGVAESGEWEARVFRNNGYELAVASNAVTIQPGPIVEPPPVVNPLPQSVYWVEMTYTNGVVVHGLETMSGWNIFDLWRASGFIGEGNTSMKVWKMELARPDRPADIEFSAIVRAPIF